MRTTHVGLCFVANDTVVLGCNEALFVDAGHTVRLVLQRRGTLGY